jgi:nicotinamidase-related amidase
MRIRVTCLIFLLASTCAAQTNARNFDLIFRSQKKWQDAQGRHSWQVSEIPETVPANQVAFIVTDLWEEKGCRAHVERISEMVPVVNRVITIARSRGAHIIWAPSDITDYYSNSAARQRMINLPYAAPPKEIKVTVPSLPVGDETISCDSEGDFGKVERQHPGLVIDQEQDGISSDGQEIWNFIKDKKIKLVLILGVHTNACILNRPFAIKQMVKWQMPIALVRDLTDASYNPFTPPYVSHEEGTSLVIEYIEKFWCPTVSIKDIAGIESVSYAPWKNGEYERPTLPIAVSRGPVYTEVKAKYHITLQTQRKDLDAKQLNIWQTQEIPENIFADQSVILIAGMGNEIGDPNAGDDSLATRIDVFSAAARKCGYTIVHAPAMAADTYQDSTARKSMQKETALSSQSDYCPAGSLYFTATNHWQPAAYMRKPSHELYEPPLPVVSPLSSGLHAGTKEQAVMIDSEKDVISDSGAEIWQFMQRRQIKNVFILGRFANEGIFSSSFGIRQMVARGANIALVRDLVDVLNDPFEPPYVTHDKALAYTIGYFEKFWCPTVCSHDLLSAE